MSKKSVYQVLAEGTMHEVATLREVSDLLGTKVTKKDIESGLIPEVNMTEVNDTITLTNPVTGEQTISPIGPTDNHSEAAMSSETMTEEEEQQIQEILEGSSELTDEEKDDLQEDVEGDDTEDDTEEGEEEPVYCAECGKEILLDQGETGLEQEDGRILCVECDSHTNDKDKDPDGKPTMSELLDRLRAINARHNADQSNNKGTNKGKRGKKIDVEKYVEENGYPEVGFFKEEKEIKNFYKKLTETQLDEWLELEGLTYKPSDNEPINRMRKCMSILYLHFPREAKSTGNKKKSKYADYSTEDLLQMAIDNDIYVKEAKGDERILRMYAIMELKKAGLLQ